MEIEQEARKAGLSERLAAFGRVLHPLPSLLTVVAAGAFVLLAARGAPPLGRLLYLLAIEAAMQFSISAFNDYFDRNVDLGRRDKPVASGIIAPGVVLATGTVLGLVAVAMPVRLGAWLTGLTVVGLAAGLAYDAGLKYTALSWLPFAVAFPTLPLWAWAGVNEAPLPRHVLWIVPVGAVLVLGIHLADTLPDLASDREAGIRGLAHRLGAWRATMLCGGAFAAGVLLTLALWAFIPYRAEWYLPGLVIGAALMLSGAVLWRLDRSRLRTGALLLELGALALAVGWVAAITL